MGGGREDAGDVQRPEFRVGFQLLLLYGAEQFKVFNGVIDRCCREDSVEPPCSGRSIVLRQNGFDDRFLSEGLTRLRWLFPFFLLRREVVDVESQDVAIVDGVGDRIGVQAFFEEVFRGPHGSLNVFDLLLGSVLVKDGCTRETKELGTREEFFDGLMVLPKLRTVAFVKDEDNTFVSQHGKQLFVGRLSTFRAMLVAFAVFIQCQAQLLDSGDDDLVGVVFRKQTTNQCGGVGVFFDATFLKLVELFSCLPVQVLAVDDEHAFVNAVVLLQQCGGLEGRQRLSAASGVPDVSVAAVVVDALHNLLHRIDLIGSHDHQLLFADDKDHVAADGLTEVAFPEESLREGVEVRDFLVVFVRELINGQEPFFGVEGKMPRVVVGKVVRAVAVADDEELHKAEQRLGITVTGLVFVFDDLFHGPARANA